MKKLVMTAAVLTCAASIVSAQTVTSANVVGYVKNDRPIGKLTIIGNNFQDSALGDIVGVDGKGFFVAGSADKVHVYAAPSGPYTSYFLYNNGVIAEWRSLAAPTTPTPSVPINNGDAVFYESHVASTVSTNLASGEVSGVQFATNNVIVGLQLMSFPFNADATLNSMDITAKGKGFFVAGSADKVHVFDPNKGGVGGYDTYFLYDNTVIKEWRSLSAPTTTPIPPITIPQGQGFFYETSAVGGAAFSAIDTNPYFGNL